MTFISIKFILFLAFAVLIYYIYPQKHRWQVLLAVSMAFYLQGGVCMFVIVMLTSIVTYLAAIWIEQTDATNRKKKRFILMSGVSLIGGLLIFVKIYTHYNWNFSHFIIPIGISYYTFSMISYLADIYWGKDKAEQNFFKFFLFVLFFPKILQGPISRRNTLGTQLYTVHRFDYKNVTFGMQLIVWGFFKKLAIADRANIFVNCVYGNLNQNATSGAILAVTSILSVLQLYCDFSGYMDIAIGTSQMFGVKMEQNFNHPFFSKSAAEFWRRWHITLGDWFRDYVYMPLVISPMLAKVSKRTRTKYGKRAGKIIRNAVPLFIVWFLTGLWHGTGINYLVWGLYWAIAIILSDILEPMLHKINRILCINTEAIYWKLFQVTRTCAIFCMGKTISSQHSLHDVKVIVYGILKHFNFQELRTGKLFEMGLDKANFLIMLFGCMVLLIVSWRQEKESIRESVSKWHAIPRWIFYGVSVVSVLMFGSFGEGIDNVSFAYMHF